MTSTIVFAYCLVVLAVAALVALTRMEKGPTMLDRVVSLDVVTAVVLGAVALVSARTARTDLVPVLVVLSIVGFVGSVTIARFAAVEAPEEARILTKEELAEVLAHQRALTDEDAPVHDPDADDADEGREGEDDDAADAQAVDARLDAEPEGGREDRPAPAGEDR
ncbi:monovalent cation/H+ antiporter complex subunit F [Georgenia sp. SUBG003]|uniref:monovalent cation/H+ antiporter complex subunit F n=1 Tax=Georgenia sp. SUBG003 TaxID=1497974 RepID=UPI003AB7D445